MRRALLDNELDTSAEESFATGLMDAMGYHLGPSRSGTYIEVLSSGQFRLLRDQQLRDALSAYDDSVQKADTLFSVFQQGQRKYETAFNRHFERGPASAREIDLSPTGVMYMHGEIASFNFEAMAGDEEFLHAIERLLEYHINYQFWHSNISRSADRVVEILAAE